MKQLGIVLRHGWSFDRTALAPLAQALATLTPHVIVDDLGYWDAQPHIPARDPALAWIGIGHSYGFASLLQEPQPTWTGLIGIGAFLRFPNPGLPALRDATARDPQRAIRAFRRECGVAQATTLPIAHPNGQRRLLATLDALAQLDLPPPPGPTLFLHGRHDRIVTEALTPHCLHADKGHSLGLEAFEWCLAQIVPFVRSLNP